MELHLCLGDVLRINEPGLEQVFHLDVPPDCVAVPLLEPEPDVRLHNLVADIALLLLLGNLNGKNVENDK